MHARNVRLLAISTLLQAMAASRAASAPLPGDAKTALEAQATAPHQDGKRLRNDAATRSARKEKQAASAGSHPDPSARNEHPPSRTSKSPPPPATMSQASSRAVEEKTPPHTEEPARKGIEEPTRPVTSLAFVSPAQLYDYQRAYAAYSLAYEQSSFIAANARVTRQEEFYGPATQAQIVVRENTLPLVASFLFSTSHDKGSRRDGQLSGDTRSAREGLELWLAYPLQDQLSLALSLGALSERTAGTYYDNSFYFAWQEYTLSGLWDEKSWQLGLIFRPGIVLTGHSETEGRIAAVARPPRWTLHGGKQISTSALFFAKLDFLLLRQVETQTSPSLQNQLRFTLGASLDLDTATYEAALLISTASLRGGEAASGRQAGERGLMLSVARPYLEQGRWGLQLSVITGSEAFSASGERGQIAAARRSLEVFASWVYEP